MPQICQKYQTKTNNHQTNKPKIEEEPTM